MRRRFTSVINEIVDTNNYLTITALEDGLVVSTFGECYYSIDGNGWSKLGFEEYTLPINTGQTISFKRNLTKLEEGAYDRIEFSINKHCNLSGNIMSIIFGDNAINSFDLSGYSLTGLFANCMIVDASNLLLPATTLTEHCYTSMFAQCTSLTTAPQLPALKLADYCYSDMFYGCTGLIISPELPATTLAPYCYASMFSGCTTLTEAPALPSTTLAEECYDRMFQGCTSLVNAPQLPATTLVYGCYRYMFSNCTSLITAPELPATTLVGYCYQYMFQGCNKLKTAPELPATTLENYCYNGMFRGCTSLTTAPELLTTTLENYCYYYMFSNCTNLNHIKMLATDISAYGCLSSWVYKVSPTGTFVKSKDATWDVTGSSGVPTGWAVITDDQESEEGDNNLISFTIHGDSYQAEEGMTWGEWVNSQYNTDGYYIYFDDSISTKSGGSWVGTSEYYVFSQDIIIEGYEYALVG